MGIWIALDGIDGCGKSTQCQRLANHLVTEGRRVTVTKEPGGTLEGRRIREILLDGSLELDPRAELELFIADRISNVSRVVVPALTAGQIIVSDRSYIATEAYQQARGIPLWEIQQANRRALRIPGSQGIVRVNLIILLDVPVERARRRMDANHTNRFDRMDFNFHQTVRQNFLNLQLHHPEMAVVDGVGDVEEVFTRIVAAIEHSGTLKKGD